MRNWYLLMAKPKQDEVAQTNLEAQGYEVYRPLCSVNKRVRGKSVKRIESLFPRYLFIRLDDEVQNWSPIRSTIGVQQMVRFGAQAAQVDQQIIDMLQQREQQLMQQAEGKAEFESGQKLRIESGPFYGLDGVFETYDSDERIIVLMNVLGSQQKITLDRDHVIKA
jgi:transcriptional antiterminator RfaH